MQSCTYSFIIKIFHRLKTERGSTGTQNNNLDGKSSSFSDIPQESAKDYIQTKINRPGFFSSLRKLHLKRFGSFTIPTTVPPSTNSSKYTNLSPQKSHLLPDENLLDNQSSVNSQSLIEISRGSSINISLGEKRQQRSSLVQNKLSRGQKAKSFEDSLRYSDFKLHR